MVVALTNTQSVSNVEGSKQFVRVVLSKTRLELVKQVVVPQESAEGIRSM